MCEKWPPTRSVIWRSFSDPALGNYQPFNPAFNFLFNSYYEAVGARHPRPRRGLLTRPSVDEVYRYRAHVDRAMSERSSAFVKAQIAGAMSLAHQLKLKVTPSFQLFPTGQTPRSFTPSDLESGAFTGPLRKMLASISG